MMIDPLQPQQQLQEMTPPATPWQHRRPPAAPPRKRRHRPPPRTVGVVVLVGTVGLVLFVLNRHLMTNYYDTMSSTALKNLDFQPQPQPYSPWEEIEEEPDDDKPEVELRWPDQPPLPQDEDKDTRDDQVRLGAHHQQPTSSSRKPRAPTIAPTTAASTFTSSNINSKSSSRTKKMRHNSNDNNVDDDNRGDRKNATPSSPPSSSSSPTPRVVSWREQYPAQNMSDGNMMLEFFAHPTTPTNNYSSTGTRRDNEEEEDTTEVKPGGMSACLINLEDTIRLAEWIPVRTTI